MSAFPKNLIIPGQDVLLFRYELCLLKVRPKFDTRYKISKIKGILYMEYNIDDVSSSNNRDLFFTFVKYGDW